MQERTERKNDIQGGKKERERGINDAQLPGSPCLAPLFIAQLTTAVDQNGDGETGRERVHQRQTSVINSSADTLDRSTSSSLASGVTVLNTTKLLSSWHNRIYSELLLIIINSDVLLPADIVLFLNTATRFP